MISGIQAPGKKNKSLLYQSLKLSSTCLVEVLDMDKENCVNEHVEAKRGREGKNKSSWPLTFI